jgi:hypothetical protein
MGSNRERYKYEKGKFVVLKQEDFARVNIINFVKIDDGVSREAVPQAQTAILICVSSARLRGCILFAAGARFKARAEANNRK